MSDYVPMKRLYLVNIKGRDLREWIGLWKVAIDWNLFHIVVIDVLFSFNLSAILDKFYFLFRLLQPIE
jgi:hypothetical protein